MEEHTCNGHMFLLDDILSRTLTGTNLVSVIGSILEEDEVNNSNKDNDLI